MKCPHCPVAADKPCEGEGVPRFCQLVDPSHKDYNDKYVDFLRERSGDTPPAPRAEPVMPGLATRAANFTKSLARHAKNKLRKVDSKVQDERLAICGSCDLNDDGTCRDCGCTLSLKTSWETEACPLGKWAAVSTKKSNCSGCGT